MVYSNILLTIGSVVFSEFLSLLKDFFIAFWEAVLGTTKQYTETSIRIKATKEKVWDTFWSSAQLNCSIPVDYNIETLSGHNDLYQVSVSVEGIHQSSYIQVLQMRSQEAFIADRYYDICEYESGLHQKFAMNLLPSTDGQSTIVNQFNFNSGLSFMERLSTSFETRWMLRAFKEHCEEQKNEAKEGEPVLDASDVFWASTASLFIFLICSVTQGISAAVLVFLALLCQEFGHLLSLNRLGVNTSNIALLPFMGSSAIAQVKFENAFNEAWSVLMGSLISLIPTMLLFIGFLFSDNHYFGIAASIFAFINLMSFLPLPPFSGERLLAIIIRSFSAHDICALLYTLLGMIFCITLLSGYPAFALIGLVMCCLTVSPAHELIKYDMHQYQLQNDQISEQKPKLSEAGKDIVYPAYIFTIAFFAWIFAISISHQDVARFWGIY